MVVHSGHGSASEREGFAWLTSDECGRQVAVVGHLERTTAAEPRLSRATSPVQCHVGTSSHPSNLRATKQPFLRSSAIKRLRRDDGGGIRAGGGGSRDADVTGSLPCMCMRVVALVGASSQYGGR